MAPFPDTCSVVLPMSAQDYLQERDSAAFRTLLSEVTNYSLKMPEHSTKRLSGMPPFFSMLYHDLITGLPIMHDLIDELRSEDAEAGLWCVQLFYHTIRQALRSCNCPQVLDLGNTEIVASWDEGEIHYKEITTQPDYSR